MPITEAGHTYGQFYIDAAGSPHLNGSFLYVDEVGTALSGPELSRPLSVANRAVSLTAAATITLNTHSDKLLLMNKAGSSLTFTLPDATGTYARYKFMVGTVNTSKYIISASAGDVMCGNILANSSTDTQSCQPWISLAATSNIKITLNATTQGGVSIGDWVELVDVATDTWAVTGIVTQSGSEATMFSTS